MTSVTGPTNYWGTKPSKKSPKRVAAGKKAARTRARLKGAVRKVRRRRRTYAVASVRRWRRLRGRTRRMTVRRVRRGLLRSPFGIGYRRGRRVRINPRFSLRGILGRWRLNRALPILGGFAGAITLKPVVTGYLMPMVPVTMQGFVEKYFGILTILAGGFLSARSRRSLMKDVGLGMIVGGAYDLIATNFVNLPFIPKVTPGYMPGTASATTSGLGASIGRGAGYSIVGASNLSMDMEPDVIGSEDLDDLI